MAHLVGFFSYKGGVGRTAILCNTALALLQQLWNQDREQGMFLVDLDYAAPGILPMLGLTLEHKGDIFEHILDGVSDSRSLKSYVRQFDGDGSLPPLYVLGSEHASRKAVTYMSRQARASAADDVDPNEFARVLEYLRRRGVEDFAAPLTLVDLGSGLDLMPRDAIGIVDQLVLVARADRQHRHALPELLSGIESAFQKHKRPAKVIIVLNQVPTSWCNEETAVMAEFKQRSEIDLFLSNSPPPTRSFFCAPMMESALTSEVILVPDDWRFDRPDDQGLEADVLRPCGDAQAERVFCDAMGSVAAAIYRGQYDDDQ